MPRKSDNGNWIFSAGEIANYEVCPYSWYLEHIKKVDLTHPNNTKVGKKKHTLWTDSAKKTYFFSRSFRLISYTLIILFLITIKLILEK